jgi:UDPglucose 6-dehydrogenase
LGQALSSFRAPERIVAGVWQMADREWLAPLLTPFTDHIEWMRTESAEMTKHALNGFLATSVAFINEIACLCEHVGADAAEVSRGLKTDRRVGPRAYLSPGGAFAGGTLARDISALTTLKHTYRLPSDLVEGVAASNTSHRTWARRTAVVLLNGKPDSLDREGSGFDGRCVALWGLTYKPGTDTLRRSWALELCRWLRDNGALVRAHDPAVAELPDEDKDGIELCSTPLAAAQSAEVLIIGTPWSEYREVSPDDLAAAMTTASVVDAGGFLEDTIASSPSVRYARVGTSPS